MAGTLSSIPRQRQSQEGDEPQSAPGMTSASRGRFVVGDSVTEPRQATASVARRAVGQWWRPATGIGLTDGRLALPGLVADHRVPSRAHAGLAGGGEIHRALIEVFADRVVGSRDIRRTNPVRAFLRGITSVRTVAADAGVIDTAAHRP